MRLHKGDKVIVISGNSKIKGKEGVILQVFPKEERVIIDGVNMIKKHQKKTQEYPEGAILEKPGKIHVSKVALIDPKDKKATKVKYVVEGDKKIRVSRRSGAKV